MQIMASMDMHTKKTIRVSLKIVAYYKAYIESRGDCEILCHFTLRGYYCFVFLFSNIKDLMGSTCILAAMVFKNLKLKTKHLR